MDYVKSMISHSPSWHADIQYHLNAFIYNTKSFLDAIAVTLNNLHKMKFRKSRIDLGHKEFISKLCTIRPELTKELANYTEWINTVIQWRDKLIHRSSLVMPAESQGPPPAKDWTPMMSMEPIALTELKEVKDEWMKKYRRVFQPILPFCEDWLKNAKEIQDITCKDLVNFFSKSS